MKIKLYAPILGSVFISMISFGFSAQAAEGTGNRENIEKYEKNMAKSKESIAKILSEIKTQQSKIEKDTAQYGQTSNEVRSDQEKLKDLREDLVDPKVDLYKNLIQKKLESGESIESESAC